MSISVLSIVFFIFLIDISIIEKQNQFCLAHNRRDLNNFRLELCHLSTATQKYRLKFIDVLVALQNELVLDTDIKRHPATGICFLRGNGAIS